MIESQARGASSAGANAQDPVQIEPEYQSRDFGDILDDATLGRFGHGGLPGPLHGGIDQTYNFGWPPAPTMAGPPGYQSSEFSFGDSQTPSMNQGFTPMIPPHTAAQPHQWGTSDHSPSNNFGAPSLFNTLGYPNQPVPGLGRQNHISTTAGNTQMSVPPFVTQMVGGRQGASAQQPGASIGPAGIPNPSQTELQANRNSPAIPTTGIRTSPPDDQALPIQTAVSVIPIQPIPVLTPNGDQLSNLDQNEGNGVIPEWISYIKPQPQFEGGVVKLRRESHVALDIIFEHLPRQSPVACSGIKIPSTGHVRNHGDAAGRTLLEFCVRLYGATTKKPYETVCTNCEKREGKKKGTPSLVDFHAQHDIIELKEGKVHVEFSFCCYPKCHQAGDNSYLLDIVLSEDADHNRIVAQHRLPFPFNVVAKLPTVNPRPAANPKPTGGRKRNIGQVEPPEGTLPNVESRRVRTRFDPPLQSGPLGNEPIDHPMPATHPRNAPQDPESSSSSSPPPTMPHPQPPRNAGLASDPSTVSKPPDQAVPPPPPPRIDGEPAPTLTEVNPESGSITGGARIWLKGMEFPAVFTLFARFGTAVVPTTFSASNLLACNLPPAPAGAPGVVDVTLSKHPQPGAPEYGTSITKFHYIGDHDQLIPILMRIQGRGYPEMSPVLQALLTALNGPPQPAGLQGGSRGAGPRDDPIETGLIEALSCLQERPNFHEIVSTTNDYNQTLAHLSIFYDYPSLLSRLVEWGIDLTIADVNGLTTLHCAYLKGDPETVLILRRGGASEAATDRLGRTPSELQPDGWEGFGSDIDLDAEVAAGLDTELYPETNDMDEQLALGEQFSALDLDDDNDSGHGQSDSEEDDASDDEEDHDGMAVDSFTGGDEGGSGSGGVASGSGGVQVASTSKEPAINIMNQLLLEKTKRKKRKNRGARMLPDTPYDAAISSVSKKLSEAEAEPEAIDFLMHGVFPSGTISLVSLKTEMTEEEVGEYQVAAGTPKYHGLLRRDREIVYCRLCPEDNQLDFKDPEEALHHMTKDHFDMGYSCDCECNETYWTSADWRRHRKRKGLLLTATDAPPEAEASMHAVAAN